MKRKKTYVDAGVLIGAVRGQADVAVKAMQILDDPAREFVASLFLKLEVLPKAVYEKRQAEVEFYEAFFAAVRHWVTKIDHVVKAAQQHAQTKGLAALDALHIAAAIAAGVDELVATKKPGKPLHRVTEVRIVSIHGTNGN